MITRSRVYKDTTCVIKRLIDYRIIQLIDYPIIQLHRNQLIEYIKSQIQQTPIFSIPSTVKPRIPVLVVLYSGIHRRDTRKGVT